MATLREFLAQKSVAFFKPTQKENGINFRTQTGQLVGTLLVDNLDCSTTGLVNFIKSKLEYEVTESSNSNLFTIREPRDNGISIDTLFENVPKAKKVKA